MTFEETLNDILHDASVENNKRKHLLLIKKSGIPILKNKLTKFINNIDLLRRKLLQRASKGSNHIYLWFYSDDPAIEKLSEWTEIIELVEQLRDAIPLSDLSLVTSPASCYYSILDPRSHVDKVINVYLKW